MKILITGSSGFLGRILYNSFSDFDVFVLNRSSGNYRCSLQNEIPKFNKSFDLVIHSAGKAHSVPKSALEKLEFYHVNVVGTLNLLKGLQKNSLPKQFVFISSVSVYGAEKGSFLNEQTPLLAKDSYGLSKIEAEKVVQEWCDSNDVVCTILRLPLLVGKNAPGNLGAMVKAIDKGYYFNIGGGSAKKSMVLAQDVAKFISIVAPIGGVYNLTDGVHPDFRELSTAITISKKKSLPFNLPLRIAKILGYFGDMLGNKAPINSVKLNKIISTLTFDDSKARSIHNWKPESVLEYLKGNSL